MSKNSPFNLQKKNIFQEEELVDQKKKKQPCFFKDNMFNKRLFFYRLLIIIICALIVGGSSLYMYFWLLKLNVVEPQIWKNSFFSFQVTANAGVGFSMLTDNPILIYSIQGAIAFFLFILIFSTKSKISIIGLSFTLCGGLFNFAQRFVPFTFMGTVYTNCVLDYFKLSFIDWWPIFNFPDVFVVVGTVWYIITFIAYAIANL